MKADDAQHAIMVAQTDIDANKAAIADTRNDVSAVQSDVTNIKAMSHMPSQRLTMPALTPTPL